MTWWGWLIVVLVALYGICTTAAIVAMLLGFRTLIAGLAERGERLAREHRANEEAMDLFRSELERRGGAWPRR